MNASGVLIVCNTGAIDAGGLVNSKAFVVTVGLGCGEAFGDGAVGFVGNVFAVVKGLSSSDFFASMLLDVLEARIFSPGEFGDMILRGLRHGVRGNGEVWKLWKSTVTSSSLSASSSQTQMSSPFLFCPTSINFPSDIWLVPTWIPSFTGFAIPILCRSSLSFWIFSSLFLRLAFLLASRSLMRSARSCSTARRSMTACSLADNRTVAPDLR